MNLDKLLKVCKEMYEEAKDPFALTDEKLNVIYANVVALEKIPNLKLADAVLELVDNYDKKKLIEVLTDGKQFTAKKTAEPLNTRSIRLVPVCSLGHLVGCQVFFENSLDESLDVSDEKSENIIKNFANAFNMPLAIISSTLGPLSRIDEIGDPSQYKSYLKIISQNSYRLLRLSHNLTTVSRYRTAKPIIKFQYSDLSDFIKEYCKAAMIVTESMGVPLVFSIPDEAVMTRFDSDQLSLAISNLICNSCAFTKEGNIIHVTLEKQDEKAVITVADKGIGIKACNLEKIFEPYYSYNEEASVSGAGLGLPIVKYVVTSHGGTVALQSAEGVGTTVAFTVPIVHSEDEETVVCQKSINYLNDKFSNLHIQLADYCECPFP